MAINDDELKAYVATSAKLIEVQTKANELNREVISLLTESKNSQNDANDKLDKIVKQGEDTSRELFQMKILFFTGIASIIANLISVFLKH